MALGDNFGQMGSQMLNWGAPPTQAQSQAAQLGAMEQAQRARAVQQQQQMQMMQMAQAQQQFQTDRKDKFLADIYKAGTPWGAKLALEANKQFLSPNEYVAAENAVKQFGTTFELEQNKKQKEALQERGFLFEPPVTTPTRIPAQDMIGSLGAQIPTMPPDFEVPGTPPPRAGTLANGEPYWSRPDHASERSQYFTLKTVQTPDGPKLVRFNTRTGEQVDTGESPFYPPRTQFTTDPITGEQIVSQLDVGTGQVSTKPVGQVRSPAAPERYVDAAGTTRERTWDKQQERWVDSVVQGLPHPSPILKLPAETQKRYEQAGTAISLLDDVAKIFKPDYVGPVDQFVTKAMILASDDARAQFQAATAQARAIITRAQAGGNIGPAEEKLYLAAIPDISQPDRKFISNLRYTRQNLERVRDAILESVKSLTPGQTAEAPKAVDSLNDDEVLRELSK